MKRMKRVGKRITALVLTVFMVFLTACASEKSGDAGERVTKSAERPTDTPVVTPEPTATPTPELDLGAEALAQLIPYVKDAMQTVLDTADALSPSQSDEEADWFGAAITTIETNTGKLETLSRQASAIPNLDDNINDAATEFFEMTISCHTSLGSCLRFCSQAAQVIDSPKPTGQNKTFSELYSELLNWYLAEKEMIDKITEVPSSMSDSWEAYKKTFEINRTVLVKADEAIDYDDWLRYYSCQLLIQRFETAVQNDADAIIASLQGELEFAMKQADVARALAEEIVKCSEMDRNRRTRYSFTNNRNGEVSLTYDAISAVYPTLYNTYRSFVIVNAGCISGTHKITVEAEIPGYTQKYRQSFTLDASYRAINIKPPVLPDSLNLASAKNAQIVVSVYEQDGLTLIDSQSFPIELKSRNDFEWYSDEYGVSTKDNILCYLQPESPAITQLKRTAIDEISAMTAGKMESFAGYQGSTWNHAVTTYLQVAGLMRALNVLGVRYNLDVFSISNSNQHILLPEEVLETRSGLCIETSLVVASALQSANMHAFLVFPPGHAQVAVEVWEGTGEYFLIETTALSDQDNSRQIFVDGANYLLNNQTVSGIITYLTPDEWDEYLSQTVQYLIDCDDSVVLGLTTFSN